MTHKYKTGASDKHFPDLLPYPGARGASAAWQGSVAARLAAKSSLHLPVAQGW